MNFSETARDFYVKTKPYFRTSSWAYAILGATIGGIAPLSLFQRFIKAVWGHGVNLWWVPKTLLAGYHAARDKLIGYILAAVHYLADWLPNQFAYWLKLFVEYVFSGWVLDLITFSLIVSVGMYRGSLKNRNTDRQRLRADPDGFRKDLRDAAKLNGLDADHLVNRVERGLGLGWRSNLYFFFRSFRSCVRWPLVVIRNARQLRKNAGAASAKVLLREWGLSIFYAIFGAAAYLISSGLFVSQSP